LSSFPKSDIKLAVIRGRPCIVVFVEKVETPHCCNFMFDGRLLVRVLLHSSEEYLGVFEDVEEWLMAVASSGVFYVAVFSNDNLDNHIITEIALTNEQRRFFENALLMYSRSLAA